MKLFLYFMLGFTLVVALAVQASAATCAQNLSVCEKSCQDRQGIYSFQCSGPGVESSGIVVGCRCFDEIKASVPGPTSAQLRIRPEFQAIVKK